MKLDIRNSQRNQKFLINISGQEISLDYDITNNGVITFLGLNIPVILQGTGYVAELIEHAISFAEEKHFQIQIMCNHIKRYYKIHHKLKKALKLI